MAYNLYFIHKRKNLKINQTNSSARILQPDEENQLLSQISPCKTVIEEARQSGVLSLVKLSLTEIPSEVYFINRADTRRIGYNGFDDKDNTSWWEDTILYRLNLSMNKIKVINDNIKFLSNLSHLDLSDNDLESLPYEFSNLINLTYLDLGKNNITELPENIGSLERLDHLLLGNNKLKSLPPEFCRLLALEVLDISNNKFTFLPDTIGYFIKLQNLNISCNSITKLPDVIIRLKALTILDISQNKLLEFPQGFESKFQILKLNVNCITQFPVFKTTPTLKELHLSNNTIVGFTNEHVSYIPNINILLLSKNAISDLPSDITQLLHIVHLDISFNHLNSIPYDLGNVESLLNLSVEGNPFRSIKRTALVSGTQILKRYLRTRYHLEQGTVNTSGKAMAAINDEDNDIKSLNSLQTDIHELNSSGTVDLCQRGLKCIPEEYFASLKSRKIRFLLLSNNSLSEFPLGIFSFAITIVVLDVSYNNILELPDTFDNFKCLEQLNLCGNYLRYLPESFVHMNNCLLSLNVAHNPLGLDLPRVIFKLKCLQTLNVSNCSITKINPNDFMKLPYLTNLDLSTNELDRLPPELGLCRHIKTLNLNGNPIRHPSLSLLDHGTEPMFQYLRSQIEDQK